MRRTIAALATAAAIGTASLATVAPANAWTVPANCEENGHRLTATFHVTQDATYHYWEKADYKLSGSGTGGESNVRLWLKVSGTTVLYDWKSPDNRVNGTQYSKAINVRSARAVDEKFRARAIFDTAGTDNRCTGLVDY